MLAAQVTLMLLIMMMATLSKITFRRWVLGVFYSHSQIKFRYNWKCASLLQFCLHNYIILLWLFLFSISFMSLSAVHFSTPTFFWSTVWVEKPFHSILRHNFGKCWQIFDFLHCRFSKKFAISRLLHFTPHLKRVTTLLYEIQTIKNSKSNTIT